MSDETWNTRELLEQATWLQRISRGLVANRADADDLVQETWTRALAGRTPSVPSRPWLARVLRNVASKGRRREARRADYEQRVPREQVDTLSPDELTSRAEAHGQLVTAIKSLKEIYRVPLLLRYYDDLPPREIATRLELPVRTVHTRLTRGLEQLRASLDTRYDGDRSRWVLALAPLGFPSVPHAASSGTAEVGASKAASSHSALWRAAPWIGAVAASAVFVTVWLWREAPNETRVAGVAPDRRIVETVERSTESPEPATDHARELRESVAVASASQPAPPSSPPASTLLGGRVIDLDGRPVPGARIRAREYLGVRIAPKIDRSYTLLQSPGELLPEPSDQDGRFAYESSGTNMTLLAEHPDYATVLAAHVTPRGPVPAAVGPAAELHVVVAPAASLAGRVVDEANEPVPSAVCELLLPADLAHRFDWSFEQSTRPNWSTTTDAQGVFDLGFVPLVPGATLAVRAPGYDAFEMALSNGQSRVAVRLPRPAAEMRRGIVTDADGRPVEGALIAWGERLAESDRYGVFEMLADPDSVLFGVAEGKRPVALKPETIGAGDELHVRLAAPPLHLAGRVVRSDGTPLAGVEIHLLDGTVVGDSSDPRTLESVAAGGNGFSSATRADADGAFSLGGLDERPYSLRVLDEDTCIAFVAGPFDPRSLEPLVITMPEDLTRDRFVGVLRTPGGEPLADALVALQCTSFSVRSPRNAQGFEFFATGSDVRTDAEGRFELFDVPRTGAAISVRHPSVRMIALPLPDPLPAEADWTLARTCRLQVVVSSEPRADRFRLLDAELQPLSMRAGDALHVRPLTSAALADGRSAVLHVPETAVWLVLEQGDEELARVPLQLRPGEVQRVDL